MNKNRINITRLKQISLDNDNFYKTLSRYRNQASHTYKKPPFNVIRDFYVNNNIIFQDINNYIKQFINSKI